MLANAAPLEGEPKPTPHPRRRGLEALLDDLIEDGGSNPAGLREETPAVPIAPPRRLPTTPSRSSTELEGCRVLLVEDAIDRANAAGVLYIAAAGNNGRNIDSNPFYPASYDSPNVISVANVTRFGSRASEAFWSAPAAALDRMARGLSFPGPVLLIAGGCNDWTGAPLQARHAGLFADARMQVIEGAGHDTAWDTPEATQAAIRSFLAAPPGSPDR
jgi:pimeloyl-ACP methyl ester carboxylesterase